MYARARTNEGCHTPRKRSIRYAAAYRFEFLGNSATTGDAGALTRAVVVVSSTGCRPASSTPHNESPCSVSPMIAESHDDICMNIRIWHQNNLRLKRSRSISSLSSRPRINILIGTVGISERGDDSPVLPIGQCGRRPPPDR